MTIGQRLVDRTDPDRLAVDWVSDGSQIVSDSEYQRGLAKVHEAMQTAVDASVKAPAGVLLIPAELSQPDPDRVGAFTQQLVEVMTRPLDDKPIPSCFDLDPWAVPGDVVAGEAQAQVLTNHLSPGAVVCDFCTAAKLAESGRITVTVPAEDLHAKCRRPDECACGCNPPPRELPIQSRIHGSDSGGPACICGCGEVTAGSAYKVGHVSRHVTTLAAGVRAHGLTLEHALEQLPTDVQRDRLRKKLEGTT